MAKMLGLETSGREKSQRTKLGREGLAGEGAQRDVLRARMVRGVEGPAGRRAFIRVERLPPGVSAQCRSGCPTTGVRAEHDRALWDATLEVGFDHPDPGGKLRETVLQLRETLGSALF